jgi:hypothetical protein
VVFVKTLNARRSAENRLPKNGTGGCIPEPMPALKIKLPPPGRDWLISTEDFYAGWVVVAAVIITLMVGASAAGLRFDQVTNAIWRFI